MGGGGEGRIWPKERLFPCEKLIDGRGSAFCRLVPHNFGQDCTYLDKSCWIDGFLLYAKYYSPASPNGLLENRSSCMSSCWQEKHEEVFTKRTNMNRGEGGRKFSTSICHQASYGLPVAQEQLPSRVHSRPDKYPPQWTLVWGWCIGDLANGLSVIVTVSVSFTCYTKQDIW